MKPETLAAVNRGLRNKLMLFAADPYISHAFRGTRERANCFTWADLDDYNILLRIPADRIEQWSGAINLMYTQLIRHLERRPDKYSMEGLNNRPILLLDEFARFGELEMITSAMSTLRSKNVNICPVIQSIAQLDKIYGERDRRIILDNCQYQAILRANDAETQKYLCELIGTTKGIQRSISENMDDFMDTTGYSRSITEVREFRIFPHELSTLEDILLLTPYGFFRVDKFRVHSENGLEYNDKTYYDKRKDVLFSGIFLPANAPTEFHQLQTLCDEIDRAENRYDARTAREFIGSLPNELPLSEQKQIVREYINQRMTMGKG